MAKRKPGSASKQSDKTKRLKLARNRARKGYCIVAEGDSWFNYIIQKDVIDYLIEPPHKMPIVSVAKPGHMLIDMTYGTEVHEANGKRKRKEDQQITNTLSVVNKYKPKAFLFSGGGNDVAGPELIGYLRHASQNNGKVDWPRVTSLIQDTYGQAYRDLFAKVDEKSPGIQFITHGYTHPFPDGRGAKFPIGRFQVSGPWLGPAFHKMGYVNDTDNFNDIVKMMNLFNDTLQDIASENERFHALDLREIIPINATNYKEWWANELHLKAKGFKAVAGAFAEKMKELGVP